MVILEVKLENSKKFSKALRNKKKLKEKWEFILLTQKLITVDTFNFHHLPCMITFSEYFYSFYACDKVYL